MTCLLLSPAISDKPLVPDPCSFAWCRGENEKYHLFCILKFFLLEPPAFSRFSFSAPTGCPLHHIPRFPWFRPCGLHCLRQHSLAVVPLQSGLGLQARKFSRLWQVRFDLCHGNQFCIKFMQKALSVGLRLSKSLASSREQKLSGCQFLFSPPYCVFLQVLEN